MVTTTCRLASTIAGACFICAPCLAGPLRDVIQDGDTQHTSEIFVSGGHQIITGDSTMVYDGDPLSGWAASFENSGTGGGGNILLRSIHTFADPRDIDSVAFHASIFAAETGTTDRLRHGHMNVDYQLFGSSTWITIPDTFFSFSNGGDGMDQIDKQISFASLNLLGVGSIRLEGQADAFANNGHTNGTALARVELFEFQALGVPEPSTFVLSAIALGGMARLVRARARGC